MPSVLAAIKSTVRRVGIGLAPVPGRGASGRRRCRSEDDWGAVLPLRELERPPRLGLAVFLALHHAAVAGEEAAALKDAAQLRLEIRQCLGEAMAHRAGLAGQSAA